MKTILLTFIVFAITLQGCATLLTWFDFVQFFHDRSCPGKLPPTSAILHASQSCAYSSNSRFCHMSTPFSTCHHREGHLIFYPCYKIWQPPSGVTPNKITVFKCHCANENNYLSCRISLFSFFQKSLKSELNSCQILKKTFGDTSFSPIFGFMK